MLFSVHNKSMQQGKLRIKQDSKPSLVSHIGERVSTLASNRSQDTKSRIYNPSRINNPSYLKEFKKNTKIKLNTLSSIGNINIEDQIKKQITLVEDLLKECQIKVKERKLVHTEKEELITLEQIIRFKDETIKMLTAEIDGLKKSDRTIIEEESPTDSSDKQRLFKLAEEMKQERQDLTKYMGEHVEKYNNYIKIKKLIEQIQIKYTSKGEGKSLKDQNYRGPQLITYEEFKEKAKTKKEEIIPTPAPKVKRIDFYHHLSPEKQANPSMNMKDLITRKNITMAALKNSRKKHNVQMTQLIAKLDFLKDQDAHLTQKIKQKEQELASMERKFSERRGEKNNFSRNPLLHFHHS